MGNMDTLKQDIEDLKQSVKMAHQDNVDTKKQGGNIESSLREALLRIKSLEVEMRSLKGYTTELDNYCLTTHHPGIFEPPVGHAGNLYL